MVRPANMRLVPAPADTEQKAERYLGMCVYPMPDLAKGALLGEIDLALVSWWSSAPPSSDSLGTCWCPIDCIIHHHVCPRGPQEFDGSDWADASDGERIAHYAARMIQGDVFPPIVVIDAGATPDIWPRDCPTGWLVDDGYHRISAAILAGFLTIQAVVFTAA